MEGCELSIIQINGGKRCFYSVFVALHLTLYGLFALENQCCVFTTKISSPPFTLPLKNLCSFIYLFIFYVFSLFILKEFLSLFKKLIESILGLIAIAIILGILCWVLTL